MHYGTKLLLQLEWQFVHELREILMLLLMIVLNGPEKLVEEWQVQLVLLLDFVEYGYLLFELGLSRIHALYYGAQGPCRVGERENAKNHEDNAEILFEIVVRANVTIPDSQHCSDREVDGGDINVLGWPIHDVLHK